MEIKEVFEPIVSFVKNFQKKEKDISKQAAKDRLKLVLMQDRASVSPDFFEMMKKEIVDVIKKYIEIDEESLEFQLTRGNEAGIEGPALNANIPIKNIKPVASNGENTELTDSDIKEITENMAEEILDQATQKTEGEVSIKAEIETLLDDVEEDEIINDDNIEAPVISEEEKIEEEQVTEVEEEPKTADVIAENVAKEMKKTAEKISTGTKKTVKRASTTKTTRKRTTKK